MLNSGKLHEAVWNCNLLPSKITRPFRNTTITLDPTLCLRIYARRLPLFIFCSFAQGRHGNDNDNDTYLWASVFPLLGMCLVPPIFILHSGQALSSIGRPHCKVKKQNHNENKTIHISKEHEKYSVAGMESGLYSDRLDQGNLAKDC